MPRDPEKVKQKARRYYLLHREECLRKRAEYLARPGTKARHREMSKARYWAKREQILANQRAFVAANRERVLERNRADYMKHRDRRLEAMKEWRHANAERAKTAHKKWCAANLQRRRELNALYRVAHRDRMRAASKRHYQKDLDRSRLTKRLAKQNRREKTAGSITAAQWKQILISYGGACAYGGPHDGPIHMDHVVPISRGGRHDASNVVPACRLCNLKKHTAIWIPNPPKAIRCQ